MLISNVGVQQTKSKKTIAQHAVRVLAVSGGKGGIGKTNVSVNLAIALAKAQKKVMLLDADLGLANVDVLLGMKPKKNLEHVIKGECSLHDVILNGPHDIKIIPASSGTQIMAQLTPLEHAGLINAFSDLSEELDVLLIDVAAGISDSVVTFCCAAQEIIMVVCNEPTSITDAYASIKLLSSHYKINRFFILANMVSSEDEGKRLFTKLLKTTDRFLDVNLDFLGAIPYDENLRKAVQKQKAVCSAYPSSISSVAFKHIARRIIDWPPLTVHSEQVSFFLDRLIQ